MRTLAIVGTDGTVVCGSCGLADTVLRRMRGLLGRTGLPSGEGLLIRPAPVVHTWFMRFPIDAVFLDRELAVLRVVADMRPWRIAGCKGARAVLELPAGAAGRYGVGPGDRLEVRNGAA